MLQRMLIVLLAMLLGSPAVAGTESAIEVW